MEINNINIGLIKDGLTGNYKKPNIFLCEVDKTRICRLETTNTNLTAKFNSYSEISFDVARGYNDIITGQTKIFPYYDKIEALRLIEVQGLGYFEIQGPSISGDGIKEIKSITAYSLEYTLSQKYLEDLYNDGTVGSVEAGYIDEVYGGELPENAEYPIITLYNPTEPRLSLLHIILEKIYGWTIGYVDDSLKTKSRQFNIDRTSVYDFLMNDICEMFNCYVTFDTYDNTINLYAEALTKTFPCDGEKTEFIITPPFQYIGTISDDGYKMDDGRWEYNSSTGLLKLKEAPAAGHTLEVVSEDITQWETDVFVSFANLSQEVNVDYSADDIKTVLTVEYGDGQNIREVNLGLPYITDLSYYNTPDWMGQELYDAYQAYNETCEKVKIDYTDNVQKRIELEDQLNYEETRVSLDYHPVSVDSTTVTDPNNGKVYYIRTGDAPNYIYVEKTLPDEFEADVQYYMIGGDGLTEDKIIELRKALGFYFLNDSMEELDKLVDAGAFDFTNKNYNGMPFGDKNYQEGTLLYVLNKYKSLGAFVPSDGEEDNRNPEEMYKNMVVSGDSADARDGAIKTFLCDAFDQFGMHMLNIIKDMYLKAQEGFIAGWNAADDANKEDVEDESAEEDDELTDEEIEEIKKEIQDSATDYPNYYPIVLILAALDEEIGVSMYGEPPAKESTGRYATIDPLYTEINYLLAKNTVITESLVMDTWFKSNYPDNYKALLMRLSPFLREDELILDEIVATELDTIEESLRIQEDALSAAYIELQKISKPQLNFSMTMANIYALPEFAPIISQFQLGKLIKIEIRPGYIKQSRLMQVNMGLDDFSDFSCEFGELTSLRSQSDIHADLLSQAASAGKQVATNSSYWTKGSDIATTTDLKIQQGLLDATTQIKSIDGTQDIVIDKYGIKLQKKDPGTGAIDPKQARFVNNMLLFTDDGWKTSKAGLGDFTTVDGESFYGLIAEAVIAGYIEGSKIVGGTINIGDGAFKVDKNGVVTMDGAGHTIDGYATTNDVNTIQKVVDTMNSPEMYRVEIISDGPITITSPEDKTTLSCRVYSLDADKTDEIKDICFNWKRISDDEEKDLIWAAMDDHQGKKSIIITADDVIDNSRFYCEVELTGQDEEEI